MEFTYRTATGNITIDVSEEWVAILQDCDRQEENNNLKERRRHYHLEACEYEGSDFAVEDAALDQILEQDAVERMLEPALSHLSKSQRAAIDAVFYKGMTVKEYADSRGVTGEAITKAKNTALKKMKKILETG